MMDPRAAAPTLRIWREQVRGKYFLIQMKLVGVTAEEGDPFYSYHLHLGAKLGTILKRGGPEGSLETVIHPVVT